MSLLEPTRVQVRLLSPDPARLATAPGQWARGTARQGLCSGQVGLGPCSQTPSFHQLPRGRGQGPVPRDTLAGTAAWLIQKETQDMATRRMEGM